MRRFSLFVHTPTSTVPIFQFEIATDEENLRPLADGALAENFDHLAVEVREEDRLLFSLDRNGTFFRGHRVRAPDHLTRRAMADSGPSPSP